MNVMTRPEPAREPGPVHSAARSAPSKAALRLGYGGLLPFVLGAMLVWLVRADAHPYAVQALSAYAAVIVSFLGGVHWGLALMQPSPPLPRLVWAVVPSLLAWPALLMPAQSALVIFGVLLLACYLVDRRVYPEAGLAAWLTLRFRLTAVASLSCFIGAGGA